MMFLNCFFIYQSLKLCSLIIKHCSCVPCDHSGPTNENSIPFCLDIVNSVAMIRAQNYAFTFCSHDELEK